MTRFFEILIFCLVFVFLFFYFVAKVSAEGVTYYNTFVKDCGTLHGKGEVRVWFNDERYIIPVDCT